MKETPFSSWVGKIWWRRDRLPTAVFLGFPSGSVGKESAYNAGDLSLISGLERSPGEGNGYSLPRILAWRVPWTEELGRLQSMGSQELDTTEHLTLSHTQTHMHVQ